MAVLSVFIRILASLLDKTCKSKECERELSSVGGYSTYWTRYFWSSDGRGKGLRGSGGGHMKGATEDEATGGAGEDATLKILVLLLIYRDRQH